MSKEGKEGFWAVSYTGLHGSGFGVIVLDTGMIVGVDAMGGVWDGEYTYDRRKDAFHCQLSIEFPASVINVLTGAAAAGPHTEKLAFELPNEMEDRVVLLQTSLGPVNTTFRKIRDFP